MTAAAGNWVLTTFSETEQQQLRDMVPDVVRRLKNCLCRFPQREDPVLLVGGGYTGTWLEHNQDALLALEYLPEAAWSTMELFRTHQRADGLLPFMFLQGKGAAYSHVPEYSPCYWHIQSVYPYARCAFEIARKLKRPEEDVRRIYDCAVRYDAWLEKFRDRSGSGLVEMYCEWDTGHDNDPRVIDGGIPHTCPGNDAVNMPDLAVMPILSADLSAMRYGGLTAIAEMAGQLGLAGEEKRYRFKAESLKERIRTLLYDPEEEFYFDRSPQGLRRYYGEHITRMFLNRVPDQAEFDRIYDRYFLNAEQFGPPFPIPSMAMSDPRRVRTRMKNCWGANSQANTAERALLWMDHYGRGDDLTALLSKWLKALLRNRRFMQELDPVTGEAIDAKDDYCPSLLLFLYGVRRCLKDA